jgi:sensor histidine kinase regulating citrate/malate metabolism
MPVEAAQLGNRLSMAPERFAEEILRLPKLLAELPKILEALKKADKRRHLRPYAEKARQIMASTRRWWRGKGV